MARRGDGLFLRGRTWILDCRVRGRRYVITLGKDIGRSVALELAHVKRAAILRGEAGIGKRKQDITFKDALHMFETWMVGEKRPSTVRGYRECLRKLNTVFGNKRLSDITPWMLEKFRKERIDAGAPIRVNRELSVLKTMYSKMIALNKYQGDNPVRAVKFRKEPRTRLRFLEPEEEARLVNAAPEPLRTMIVLAINTGLRRREMLTLHWNDIDVRRGLLTVQSCFAKNGCERTVPLNAIIRDALTRHHRTVTSDLVFPGRHGELREAVQTPFEHACKQAGLTGVTLHTLRHTFASRLVLAGVDLRTVQELGGWKTIAMVERYSQLTPAHKARAVEKLAEFHNEFHNTGVVELHRGVVMS